MYSTTKLLGNKLIEELEEMRFVDEDERNEDDKTIYRLTLESVSEDEIYLNILNAETDRLKTFTCWEWLKVGLLTFLKDEYDLILYEDDEE